MDPNAADFPQIAQARGISGNSSRGLNANVTVARIATQCDGTTLLRVLEAAADRLERGADEVNALNVYPVPDGDTGTNMLHTVRSALKYARAAEPTLAAVSAAAAHGALMGARGNSGVILSQVIRGLKEGLASAETVGAVELAKILDLSRRHAHDAVTVPAPGTMLTVTAAIADATAGATGDAIALLERITTATADAVKRTENENPTNKAAHVIDAGARGLQLLLEGARDAVTGARETAEARGPRSRKGPDALDDRKSAHGPPPRTGREERAWAPPEATSARALSASASAHARAEGVASWKGAYDVQFLVEHPTREIAQVRREMEEFGADCVIVVGDEEVIKVHVHTLHPDQIIRIGLSAGRIGDVVVEDLDAMTAEHERATGIVVEPPSQGEPPKAASDVGVLAIVPGAGFANVAVSLGATPLRGGATMNPSTEEILAGIRETNARHVIVLPNDKNVILAAESAAKLAGQPVTVIPTRNVGQGMAALVAFDPNKEAAVAVEEMREVSQRAHGIEVTRAIRTTTTDGQDIREGEAIALIDGRIVAHGEDDVMVLVEAAKRLTDTEVFTLYSGADVDASRVEYAASRLRASCPRASVEVVAGGQAHYPFIVTAE
ncbi:MAG: DAK2 domain-containing protein [Chloroflexota bacterium]|nr:DAK2 domain-containing protein [Chloroflexota bacterium]